MRAAGRVFKQFDRIYGPRWTSRFDGETDEDVAENVRVTKEAWALQLHGLTGDDLLRGLRKLADRPERDVGWPPSAPEFRKLCERPHREPYEREDFQGCALSRDRMLEQQPASRAYALDQIAALRGRMGADHG